MTQICIGVTNNQTKITRICQNIQSDASDISRDIQNHKLTSMHGYRAIHHHFNSYFVFVSVYD